MGFVARWFTPSKSDGSGMMPTKPLAPPQMGTAPTPQDAEDKAKQEMDKKRRMLALSGGKTILTSESSPTGTAGKTLLGA